MRLIPQTRTDARAMIDAMDPADRAQVSADWLAQLEASSESDPWVHGFRIANDDAGVGDIVGWAGFKGPPRAGVVEISYAIEPDHRGRGLATEAAAALVDFAFSHAEVRVVCAHTLPDNHASRRVLLKSGFHHVGEVLDPDDGLVMRFERAADR